MSAFTLYRKKRTGQNCSNSRYEQVHLFWPMIGIFCLFVLLTFAVCFIYSNLLSKKEDTVNTVQGLDLGQLTTEVSKSLADAEKQRLAQNRAALFQVKSFDLEVSFVIKKQKTASGSIGYEAVVVDNQMEKDVEATQKITLHMEVVPSQYVVQGPAQFTPNKKDLMQSTIIGPKPPVIQQQ